MVLRDRASRVARWCSLMISVVVGWRPLAATNSGITISLRCSSMAAGQRGVDVLCRARAQPDPLERQARGDGQRGHSGGGPNAPDPLLLGPGATRQPTHLPWATSFTNALTNLRAVAFAPT